MPKISPSLCPICFCLFCVEGFDYTCTSLWAISLIKKTKRHRKALFTLWTLWQLNREFWDVKKCVFFWYIKHTEHFYMNASHYHPTITWAGLQDSSEPCDLGNKQCYISSVIQVVARGPNPRSTKHLLMLLKVNISHKALRWISCN